MKIPFVLGQLTKDVTVGHLDRPDLVWVSPPPTDESDELLQQVEAFKLKERLEGPSEGGLAAVRFSEDGLVYRAKVISIDGDSASVRFIDYGNSEVKKLGELYRLPPSLCSPAGLALEVRVAGAEGTKDSAKNRDRVAAKLGKSRLEVVVTDCSTPGVFMAAFSYSGKAISFSKKKEDGGEKKAEKADEVAKPVLEIPPVQEPSAVKGMQRDIRDSKKVDNIVEKLEPKKTEVLSKPLVEAEPVKKPEEPVVEVPKPTKKPTEPKPSPYLPMFSCLPSLALLEGVLTSGTVTYVSPQAGVWFSPQWAQDKLTPLMQLVDYMGEEGELKETLPREGLLCLAKSEDGCLYRARVSGVRGPGKPDAWVAGEPGQAVTVEFFDYGNLEEVGSVLEYPATLGLELAPAATEVVPVRPVPKGTDRQGILESCLMLEEGRSLELQLEKDKDTEMKVARFYEGGVEIVFDNKIEASAIFDEARDSGQPEEDDVVIEEENVIEAESLDQNKNVTKAVHEKKNMTKEAVVSKAAEEAVLSKAGEEACVKLVEGAPMPQNGSVKVVLVLVESVARVWVTREEEEAKVEKMMAVLQKKADQLVTVRKPALGCVYGARFSEDGVMYRAVVEKIEAGAVTVRFIDYGNYELKVAGELVQLTEKMAKYPAAALAVDLEQGRGVEDSPANRDIVEQELEGVLEIVFKQGKAVEKLKNGLVIDLGLVKKPIEKVVVKKPIIVKDVVKKPLALGKDAVKKPLEKDVVNKPVEKTVVKKKVVVENVVKNISNPKADPEAKQPSPPPIEKKLEVGSEKLSAKKPLTSSDSSLSGDLVCLHDALVTEEKTAVCSGREATLGSEKEVIESKKPKLVIKTKSPVVSLAKAVEDSIKVVKPRHGDQTTYVPPALRRAGAGAGGEPRKQLVAQVQEQQQGLKSLLQPPSKLGPEVQALKSLLEKELPVVLDRHQLGLARVDKIIGSSKVDDWLNKNEAQRLGDLVEPVQESTPVSSATSHFFPDTKREVPGEEAEVAGPETRKDSLTEQVAQETLAKLLARAPHSPSSLMVARETSQQLQELIPLLPPASLQILLTTVLHNFSTLSVNSSACRVVQALLEHCPSEQVRQVTCLLEEPTTLAELVEDRFGTFVAQACLGHLTANSRALMSIVAGLQGRAGVLGATQHGTFFLQRLVEVLGTGLEGAACILHEDILGSVATLAVSEAGTRLVQAVLKVSSMGSVVRVACWLETNMELVVGSRPAVFTALAVLERLGRKVEEEGGDWGVVLDRLARALLIVDKVSGQPLLVTAALDPVAHLLAREVVARANMMVGSKSSLLLALQQHLDLLRYNKTGANVLRGLQGVV